MDPPDVYEEKVGVRDGVKREVCEEGEGGEGEEGYGDMRGSDQDFLDKKMKPKLEKSSCILPLFVVYS